MLRQMIDDNADGTLARLGAKAASNVKGEAGAREAGVSPYPTLDVSSPEPADTFVLGGPVTSVTGAPVVGAAVTGEPRDGGGKGPAELVGDLVTGEPRHTGGEAPAEIVGNLVTGPSPRSGVADSTSTAKLVGELVTGEPHGGYAPGVHEAPTRDVPNVGRA